MFIKSTKKRVGDKTYVNHVLVESVATPKGPATAWCARWGT